MLRSSVSFCVSIPVVRAPLFLSVSLSHPPLLAAIKEPSLAGVPQSHHHHFWSPKSPLLYKGLARGEIAEIVFFLSLSPPPFVRSRRCPQSIYPRCYVRRPWDWLRGRRERGTIARITKLVEANTHTGRLCPRVLTRGYGPNIGPCSRLGHIREPISPHAHGSSVGRSLSPFFFFFFSLPTRFRR